MISRLRKRIDWLLKSFEKDTTDGASSRKLSVFVVMMCVIVLHFKFVTPDNALYFLIADFAFILMIYIDH